MKYTKEFMNNQDLSIIRIYFRHGQKAKEQSFWKRLLSDNLGHLLLKKAKEAHIYQAAIFTAKSGYLQGGPITVDVSEIPSHHNPVCLELLDTEINLRNYLTINKNLLADTHVILLKDPVFHWLPLDDELR